MKNEKLTNYFILLSFFLYFVILIIERIISLSLTFSNGVNIFSGRFNGTVYVSIFLSFAAFLIFMIIKCRKEFVLLFKPNSKELENYDFKNLCLASGIILISGMVHSEYTISWLQFISYGILIIGILLKVILTSKKSEDKFLHYLSFVYIVTFSMSIPVMYFYPTNYHLTIHIIEIIAVYALVYLFTMMLLMIFKGSSDLFHIAFIIPVILFVCLIVGFTWHEKNVNMFAFIFMLVTFVVYLVAIIYKLIKKRKMVK